MLAAEHPTNTREGRRAILRRGAALNRAVRVREAQAEAELLGVAYAPPQETKKKPRRRLIYASIYFPYCGRKEA